MRTLMPTALVEIDAPGTLAHGARGVVDEINVGREDAILPSEIARVRLDSPIGRVRCVLVPHDRLRIIRALTWEP